LGKKGQKLTLTRSYTPQGDSEVTKNNRNSSFDINSIILKGRIVWPATINTTDLQAFSSNREKESLTMLEHFLP
jgi:hypothetical protein